MLKQGEDEKIKQKQTSTVAMATSSMFHCCWALEAGMFQLIKTCSSVDYQCKLTNAPEQSGIRDFRGRTLLAAMT